MFLSSLTFPPRLNLIAGVDLRGARNGVSDPRFDFGLAWPVGMLMVSSLLVGSLSNGSLGVAFDARMVMFPNVAMSWNMSLYFTVLVCNACSTFSR